MDAQSNNKMRIISNIVKIISFLGILLYICMHITYVLREDTLEKECLMGFYAEPKNSLDVVMIGTSALRSSINPLDLWNQEGITSYVVATSSQRPTALKYFLNEARKLQPDAVYVIDVNLCRRDDSFWERQNEGSLRHITDGMKYSLNRIMCINDLVKVNKAEYYFDLIKYHTNWQNISISSLKAWNYEVNNPQKGFLILDKSERVEQQYVVSEERFEIPEYGEQTLRSLLDYCRENEIKAEFIIPVSAGMKYSECQCISEIVAEYGYECLVFNDFLDEMEINNRKDFYDALHTNVSGASKATKFFGNWLSSKYKFKEKSDTDIARWNSDMEKIKPNILSALDIVEKTFSLFGEIEVEYVCNENTVTWRNLTESEEEIEYAWYVYEKIDGTMERIYTAWYSSSPEFMYTFEEGKEYSVTAFVRVKDNKDSMKYKTVGLVRWDKERKYWIIN